MPQGSDSDLDCTEPQLPPWLRFPGPTITPPGLWRVSMKICLMPGVRSHLVTDHELRTSDAAPQLNRIERETTGRLRGLRPPRYKDPLLSRYHHLAFVLFTLCLRSGASPSLKRLHQSRSRRLHFLFPTRGCAITPSEWEGGTPPSPSIPSFFLSTCH